MHDSADHKIDAAFTQLPKAHRRRFQRSHVECDLRIAMGQPVDDGRDKSACQVLWTPDPYLSGSWVREKLNVTDALLQLVGDDLLAAEQRICVHRWLNPARPTIQQSHAQGGLKLRHGLGNGWLRHPKIARSFRHTASPRNGLEDMQVAQREPPTQALLPFRHRPRHREILYPSRMIQATPIARFGLGWVRSTRFRHPSHNEWRRRR